MSTPPPRRRRWVWRLVIGLGVVVVLVIVLVLLAPTIAGSVAPGIAAKQINAQIQGKADVGGASFSWTGGQVVGPVTITAPDGTTVAHVKLTIDRGLTSLLRSGLGMAKMDLGTVTVSGDASVVRHADGTTNLQQAIAPRQTAQASPTTTTAPSSGGTEVKLPNGLTATLILDKLSVRYHDEGKPAGFAAAYVELPDVSGKASITDATKASLDLKTEMRYGAAANAVTTPGGTLKVAASADSLTDASGKLTPDRVKVDATIDAADLSLKAADALAGLNDRLTAALGDSMQAKIRATGTTSEGSVSVLASSPQSKVDLSLKSAGGVITNDKPGTIEVNTAGLAKVAPSVVESIKNGELALETFPRVTVTLDSVHIPSAALTGGADLRGAGAHALLETTEITGTVLVPEGVAGAKAGDHRPFRVEPFKAELAATDLSKGANIKAATAMSLAGESAGSIKIDLTAGDLLDASGHRRAGLPSVQGRADIAGVSTAIAQPLVEKAGLDLPHGVGPKLDLVLVANTATGATAPASSAGGSTLPPTNIDLQVRSQGVTADAALLLDARGVRQRDNGIAVGLSKLTQLAGAAARKSGVEITGDGYVKLAIKDFVVPLDSAGKIDVAALVATIETTLGGLAVRPIPAPVTATATATAAAPATPSPTPAAPMDPIILQQFFLNIALRENATPRLDLKGSGSHQGNAFFTQGAFDLPGLREVLAAAAGGGDAAGKAMQLRPVGQLELRNLPISLATMMMSPPADGGADMRKLVQDAVGPSATVKLAAAAVQGSDPTARSLVLSVKSPRVEGAVNAAVDSKAFTVAESPFATTVTPDLWVAIFEATGKKLERQPTLAGPASLKLTILPLTIPMNGLSPRLDQAGDAGMRVELPGPAVVQNVVLAGADGKPPRDIGPVGMKDVLVTASVPLSSLGAGATPKPAKADMSATLLGDGNQVVGTLKGGGQVALAGGQPSGPMHGTLSVELLNTPKIDALLDQPGMVSGAVGDRIKIDADADVVLSKAPPSAPPAPGTPAAAAQGSAIESLTAHASIVSPRLNTAQPFSLSTKDGIASEDKPAVLKWNVDHAWANRFLPKAAPAAAGQPASKALLTVAEDVDVTVSISVLKLAMGGTGGLLKPGVFAADAQIATPAPKLLVSGVPTNVKNVLLRAASGREPNVLGFSLRVDDLGAGPAPGGGPAVDFAGGLYGIADAQGNPTFGAAKLTASGNASKVPTAIIDAVASQGGLLVDALGPTASLTAEASGASGTGGKIKAKATSERAVADLSGTIRDGTFISDVPLNVKVSVVTSELGKRLTKGLPALGNFEKTTADAPATVVTTGLAVPLDGNMSKLNGIVKIDPGEARFSTSSVFGKLLKVISQKDAGTIGKKLQPLELTIKNGVITYDRYSIPLGEFTLATMGTVDLVSKKMDVITYVPLGSLSDEAAGVFNTGIGGALGGLPLIDKATMVPVRTSGSFDNPTTKPDFQLFLKETGGNLLKPGAKVGEGLQDLLKGIGQPKDKPKK